jgi:hypothetical protein
MRERTASARALRLRGPFPSSAKPAIPKGSSNAARVGIDSLREGELLPIAEALEIVRVDFAMPAPGVKLAGEKEQLKLLGTPLQESEMGLLNDPDCGVAVTVKLPDFPVGMVTDDGEALKDTVDESPTATHVGE